MDDLLTIPQLAALLGVSPVTLRMQIRRGVLHAEKHGRDWFVAGAEAERYAREHRGKHGFASKTHPYHGRQGHFGPNDGDSPTTGCGQG